ncbi:glycosyltransferase family A protein [Marinimicrobium sp. LS-A18]|uniref:glycosyltransferase family 2 protein n=1 Tax=Marinimicrobium sp. LS-A18 TaxID=1381596 RepID=UPI0004679679|nr:glycosyltransferase family A protein [Marinimicrobium sp. LS-A18]
MTRLEQYLDLVRRRGNFGRNVGSADFLIDYLGKDFFMLPPGEVYSLDILAGKSYRQLAEWNKHLRKLRGEQELVALIDYADLLRKVQMTESFLGVTRYLICQMVSLPDTSKRKLLKLARMAFLVSGDVSLFTLVSRVAPEWLPEITLPGTIHQTLPSELQQNVTLGEDVDDQVFDRHNSLAGTRRCLATLEDRLTDEQYWGLSLNQAAFEKSRSRYNACLNELFSSFQLSGVDSVDLDSDNVLNTIVATSPACALGDQGLVSVIVSCFNAEDTVGYALSSLSQQTYQNIEILVCDDGSNDASMAKILEQAKKDARIRVFRSRKNQGTYNIRNALIHESSGEFVTFHDSDDWAHPQKLEQQLAFITDNGIDVCSTRWIRIDPAGAVVFFVDGRMYRFCVVSTMAKRSVFSVVPRFRESLVAADTEFHASCVKLLGEHRVKILNKPLVLGLWGEGSLTRAEGLKAENNGYVAERRRRYSEVSARQQVLGSRVVADEDVIEVLKQNNIYREFSGVEAVVSS